MVRTRKGAFRGDTDLPRNGTFFILDAVPTHDHMDPGNVYQAAATTCLIAGSVHSLQLFG